jgi:hypothetical protein
MLDGKVYTMEIPSLTYEKLTMGMQKRNQGALIQDAFPYLSADEREFLHTGITKELWNETFARVERDD